MVRRQQLSNKNISEIKRLYTRVFNSPDGEALLDDLEMRFGGTTLKKVNGTIDPNASIAAAGCREVLIYINLMRKEHAVD
jgi:hypothetical protein